MDNYISVRSYLIELRIKVIIFDYKLGKIFFKLIKLKGLCQILNLNIIFFYCIIMLIN